jgi:hypothetical protein
MAVQNHPQYPAWSSALDKLNKAKQERLAAQKAKLSSEVISKLKSIEIGAQQSYDSICAKLQ